LLAARASTDPNLEVYSLIDIGEMEHFLSNIEAATSDLQRALLLSQNQGVAYLEAIARNDLGIICIAQERYAEALEWLTAALPLSKGVYQGRLEGVVEVNLSRVCLRLGMYTDALHHAERSLGFYEQASDAEGMAFARLHMARVWQHLGKHDTAIELCEQALALDPDSRRMPDMARTLETLGDSFHFIGEKVKASAYWREALAMYEQLDFTAAAARVRDRLANQDSDT
jgi:tetratricopeptide (TPR) repeat protein